MLYREIEINDSLIDILKINKSASKWKKTDLDLLDIDYQYLVFDNIQIGIKDIDISMKFSQDMNLFMIDELIPNHRKICSKNRNY